MCNFTHYDDFVCLFVISHINNDFVCLFFVVVVVVVVFLFFSFFFFFFFFLFSRLFVIVIDLTGFI